MQQKLKKLIALLKIRNKYPRVVYFGAPFILRPFLRCKPRVQGFYSQMGQDKLLLDFLNISNKTGLNNIFVDVGCNDPEVHSNSLLFERDYGFRTIAIDAIQEMEERWRQKRPNATFVNTAVGSEKATVEFVISDLNSDVSMFSSVAGFSDKILSKKSTRIVKQETLQSIFDSLGVDCISIMSLDIEGYEFNAIKGIDFDRTKINLMLVENNTVNHGLGDNSIRDYLISKGFDYVARVWNLDDLYIRK